MVPHLEGGAHVDPLHEVQRPRHIDAIALAVGVLEAADVQREQVVAVDEC